MKDIIDTLKEKYRAHKQLIDYNKELFIGSIGAAVGGIAGGEIAGSLGFDNSDIALASSAGDMFGYYSLWGITRYLVDKKGKFSREWFFKDLTRFLIVNGISSVVYYTMRTALNGYWLAKGYDPAYASVMAQIPSGIVSGTIMNLLGYKAGLFKTTKEYPEELGYGKSDRIE